MRNRELPGLLEMIPDETVAIDPQDIRTYLEKVKHPAMEMGDIAALAKHDHAPLTGTPAPVREEKPTAEEPATAPPALQAQAFSSDQLEQLKASLINEIKGEIKQAFTTEIVNDIIGVLSERFLGVGLKNTSPSPHPVRTCHSPDRRKAEGKAKRP